MKEYNFNISLSVLNHLGRNLYRNFITVLGEAISNSWDADANNVWIEIDRENKSLLIKDDGNGMSEDDFQNKFLKIGYSKRKEGENKTKKGRPYIGRKGIGKLALLSCAEKISIFTKTNSSEYTGGTIDNSGLDEAIKDNLSSSEYKLEIVQTDIFTPFTQGHTKGTIIYFENITDGIRNHIDYIRKLIALYFRFSLKDNSFNLFLNGRKITSEELADFSSRTQFLWNINNLIDPFIETQLTSEQLRKPEKKLTSKLSVKGFIASVEEPKFLKIPQTQEKTGIDLFVNGRLREKDILKHIPSARIVESYLYGQIHYDRLDDENDRFTSSREGVISDDPLFVKLLEEIKSLMSIIIEDWDVWRVDIREEGDSENIRLTKKERKSKALFNIVADEFVPPKESGKRDLVDEWVRELGDDAQFNLSSYAECFVSENLLRKYIKHKNQPLSREATNKLSEYKLRESKAKKFANIHFEIREDSDDLHYFSMDDLANLADKPNDPQKEAGLSRDARVYKPVRDAMAHTSILTNNAKNSLSLTFENIKARIKTLLSS